MAVNKDKQPRSQPDVDKDKTLFGIEMTIPIVLFLFGMLGLVAVSLYSWGADGVRIGELILISIASMIFGGILGFLFGIPKSAKYSVENQEDGRPKPNTNLEEISDWLTKIIVGIGLSQLPQIANGVESLVSSIHRDLPKLPNAIILFLLIYFTFYGFFFSYLSVRIFLPSAFVKGDQMAAAMAAVKSVTNKYPDGTSILG